MNKTLATMSALIHGDRPTPLTTALLYATGTIAAIFLLVVNTTGGQTLTVLQGVVLFVLALDMNSGIVANFTRSTNGWYWRRGVGLRVVFVLVHVIHPLLAVLVLAPGQWGFFWATWLYMLLATGVLLLAPVSGIRKPLAAAFFAIGVVVAPYLLAPPMVLAWFVPVYFAKLILGFATDHYGSAPRAATPAAAADA